jgi:hypothetical protein
MPIQIKNHKVLNGLLSVPYHGKLIEIICWVAFRYIDKDRPLVITSGYRAGDPGVHGTRPLCRGIDIRSWVFDNPQAIVDEINTHFEYDPDRPEKKCALLHDTGSGEHIHLQSHPRTKQHKNRKKEVKQ